MVVRVDLRVLQADKKSVLRYVVFDGFDTLKDGNWQLTGAVSFYESDVDIFSSEFKNNNCEDALNIIRSKFLLDNILIKNTPFDGLDVDFGNGQIVNSRFINTNNDGVDFSGSKVTITDCLMDGCKDKGISVGEETTASVNSATIKNCNIAVASKDLSNLTINNINIENCTLGFAAYQKKPEFGGSQINVKNYTAQNVKRLYQIPPGSTLTLKGRVIEEQ